MGVSAALGRGRSLSVPDMARAGRRVLSVGFFGILPVALLLVILVGSFHIGTSAWSIDFDGNFYTPAREIVHGLSPYHPDALMRVRDAVANGHKPDEFQKGVFVAYPAPALLLGVPFQYLPLALAQWLWIGCMLGAGALALRIAGVRDWRVYGAALLTPAAVSSLMLGAVDLVLVLGLALCWRWREHAGRAGLALGAIIALKLLAAPLIAWLLVTRRWRAAAIACATSAALCSRRLGADRLPRDHGLPAPALGADRHREQPRLLARGLRERARDLRLGRAARAVRRRRGRARRDVDREPAPRGRRRGGLPARGAGGARVLADRLAPLSRAAVRAAGGAAPALRPVWALPMLFWLAPDTGTIASTGWFEPRRVRARARRVLCAWALVGDAGRATGIAARCADGSITLA